MWRIRHAALVGQPVLEFLGFMGLRGFREPNIPPEQRTQDVAGQRAAPAGQPILHILGFLRDLTTLTSLLSKRTQDVTDQRIALVGQLVLEEQLGVLLQPAPRHHPAVLAEVAEVVRDARVPMRLLCIAW